LRPRRRCPFPEALADSRQLVSNAADIPVGSRGDVGLLPPLAGAVGPQVPVGTDIEGLRECDRPVAGDADVRGLLGDEPGDLHGVFDAGHRTGRAAGAVASHDACVRPDDSIALDRAADAGVEPRCRLQVPDGRPDRRQRTPAFLATLEGPLQRPLASVGFAGRAPGAAADEQVHTRRLARTPVAGLPQ
jgi:hypothetical protein